MTIPEQQDNNEYSKSYSEGSLFDKIKDTAQKAGINVIYAALLLFYTLQKPSVPAWAKSTIIGALGYLISPIDAIPDFIPIVGYADDLGVIVVALAAVVMFIDDEVKKKAKDKLKDWFGNFDEASIEEIDKKIKKKEN